MAEEERAAFTARNLHVPRYPFALRPAELGAFLSHRKAWKEILDRGLHAAAIFEDDIELSQPGFGIALEAAVTALATADLVRLRFMHRISANLRSSPVPVTLWPTVTPLGAFAQVVGRNAARKLLDSTDRIDRPVDSFIQMRWISHISVCEVAPSHVLDRSEDLGGSTIQVRGNRWSGQFRRNLKRTVYRARIRWLSMRHPPASHDVSPRP
jgi:GR25 family glycosyltransferase involved in LPS biosynthesis